MIQATSTPQLLEYTDSLLAQMDAVVMGHCALADGPFSNFVGPHVRHILEHYETLAVQIELAGNSANAPVLDYDARARDQRVQSDPAFARKRIAQLRTSLKILALWPDAAFVKALHVRARGGLQGDFCMEAPSTWLRELMFLASHSVHHFAVVKMQALQLGTDLGTHFGKAPATVSYESRTQSLAAVR